MPCCARARAKHYLALVEGDWVNDRQHIKLSLSKWTTQSGERRVKVDPDGQRAHTIVSLKQRFGGYSLVDAELRTGRTHQIRVHLASSGFPIVGDDKYGNDEVRAQFSRQGFGRMFLHAHRLTLAHPLTGETLTLTAELPRMPEVVETVGVCLMSMYTLVVFDWDGTLMDSTHSIVAAIQGACRDLELPVPSASDASWVIGLSLESALRRAVPELTQAMVPRFLERYRTHYLLRDPELRLFDGVPEMLDALAGQGIQLAVATGKSRIGLNRALAATGLGPRFAATRTADETFSKPHPAMLHELMQELDVTPEQVLMVGTHRTTCRWPSMPACTAWA